MSSAGLTIKVIQVYTAHYKKILPFEGNYTNSLETFLLFICYYSAEDVAIGKCLTVVGGIAQETRDQEGKERLIVFDIALTIVGYFPEWYITWHEKRGALKVSTVCKI